MDIFMIAAEPSADHHGAKLLRQIQITHPELICGGIGGPDMRREKFLELFPMEKFCVMGFIDVFKALARLTFLFFSVKRDILKHQPKAVVFIDYPGFNLRLAKSLRSSGFKGKLIHYICPSVWAWGKGRIHDMGKTLDLLLTILPFEPALFSNEPLEVRYVGHPLSQIPARKQEGTHLSIFPGSRKQEIQRNLPLQLRVAHTLKKKHPNMPIAISIADQKFAPMIQTMAKGISAHFYPKENTHLLMEKTKLALATSGTITLELALHQTPTVVCYAIRTIDCWIAQKIFNIHLPFYCLVNILGEQEIFPEFFGPQLTYEAYLKTAQTLLDQPTICKKMIENCSYIREQLGPKDASKEASVAILALAF